MIAVVALVLLVVIAIGIACSAITRTHRERTASHGLARRIVRWHLGHHWTGEPITDAGWRRHGRKALTKTGHARRFWYRPQRHRMAIRVAETEGPLLALYGLLFFRSYTIGLLAAGLLAGIAWQAARAWRAHRRRRFRKSWVFPLHQTLSPLLGVPLANKPESYLSVAPDRSSARLELPVQFRSGRDMQRIEQAVTDVLGIEAPEITWDRSGARPVVTFTRSATPARVMLGQLAAAIAAAGPDEVVLGIGKRGQPVTVNLHADSPHIALSMGSGGGKSTAAKFIGAQVMHKGGITLWLDPKWISHPWVTGGRLPNAAYAKTDAQIHYALVWLGRELDRRNRVADAATDIEGNVHADVGPRLLVVIEELNLLVPRLRAWWRDNGSGGPSPAIEALAAVSAAGRQVRINLLLIAQRLSAAASGGGDSRENIGIRILGRYSAQAWAMLAAEFPMPAPDDHPGRVQVVTSKVAECQVATLSGAEAIRLATTGTVTPCPAGMPGICAPDPRVTAALPGTPLAETAGLTPESPPPGGISLARACEVGILPCKPSTAKVWRRRYREFPQPVGYEGLTHLYDPEQLDSFAKTRR